MKLINKFYGLLLIFCILLLSSNSFAKRVPPPVVPAITHQGISYSAAYAKGGIIEAHDIKTKQLLWKAQVYRVQYKPALETDVQDIFITRMTLNKDRLLITDEKNRHYSVNIHTHRVQTEKVQCHCAAG
ncbi:MAG TPA: hypothetical protein VHZ76_04685 [Gammaproteobacteria bacterium]|jgi:hypothetical protein|nr:hypothetical protein [Gammaproteobacteria bacterium]